MGLGDFWLQFNNGKKENLSDIKGDIRRETVNKKYQKIFDFFDTNKNGAIEGKEAEKFIEVISKFAGEDKILTKTEAASIFSEIGIKTSDGIDFIGFAQELSEANKKIKTSEESSLPDGSRKVVTNYTNGARFTAVYYPDGELKYTIKELPAKGTSVTNSVNNIVEAGPVIDDPSVNPTLRTVRKVEFSERAKSELRQNFGGHFEETASNILSLIEPFLSDMTVWDRAGIDMRQAFVNGDLTDMFTAEGVKKLEEFLAKAKDDKELGQKLVEMAQNQVGTFEFHLEKDFGIKDFDFEKMENFHQTSTKYMNAKSLKQRVELLNKGLKEVKQLYQNALTKKKGVPNSDKLNSDYDKKFMEVLTEYFNGDEGVAAAFFNTMKEGLATGTKDENEENDVLITILERIQQATSQTLIDSLQGEKFENLEGRYKSEFKDIYGVEDNTTEVENIIQTGQEIGGTIKIGAMTTIQILLSALTMGTGNAALIATMSNPLVSYLTTIGTDYALSVAGALSSVNGLTAEKHDRILESTVETAKFIGVGSLSAPLCRFVGNTMAKYTGKLFENGVKTTTGNVTATVVTGENFLQKICSKSANFTGSFGTELGVFTGYEVVTQDEDFDEAAGSQTTMLSQLKVINKFLQTALGKFVQTQSAKGQQKLAEQQYQKFLNDTGLDKAKITRYETPTGTRFSGEINGIKFAGTTEAEIQTKLLYAAALGVNEGVNEGAESESVKTKPTRDREGMRLNETSRKERVQMEEVTDEEIYNEFIAELQSAWQNIINPLPENGKIQKSFGDNNNCGKDVYLDSKGNVVQVVYYNDRKNNDISNVDQYVLSPDGKVTEYKMYEDGELNYTNKYEYDKNGNRTRISTLNRNGKEVALTTQEYDKNNTLIKREHFENGRLFSQFVLEQDGTKKDYAVQDDMMTITKPDGTESRIYDYSIKKDKPAENKVLTKEEQQKNIEKIRTKEDLHKFFNDNFDVNYDRILFENLSDEQIENIKSIMLSINKDSSFDESAILITNCLFEKSEYLRTIKEVLAEPSTKENLIDCIVVRNAFLMSLTSSEKIRLTELMEFRKTCKNPVLQSIDNVLYITSDIHDKFLTEVLDYKDTNGNYIIDSKNIDALKQERFVDILRFCPNARTKETVNMLLRLPKEAVFFEGCARLTVIAQKVFSNPDITPEKAELEILKSRAEEIAETYNPNKSKYTDKNDYNQDLRFYNYLRDCAKTDNLEALRTFVENAAPGDIEKDNIIDSVFAETIGKKSRESKVRLQNVIRKNIYNNNIDNVRRDIDITLENIKDEHVLEVVKNRLEEVDSSDMNRARRLDKYREIQNIIDIYNNTTRLYTTINNPYQAIPYYREFLDFCKNNEPAMLKELTQDYSKFEKIARRFVAYISKKYPKIADNLNISKYKEHYKDICADFQEELRIQTLREYCKNNNDELSDYMYADVYLKSSIIPEEIKQQCADIHKKYGVKIFLPPESSPDTRILDFVKRELQTWSDVSGNKAKLPPTIDFLTAKDDYLEEYAGFSEASRSGAISLKGFNLENTIYALRHEITHTNDSKLVNDFPDGIKSENLATTAEGETTTVVDLENCRYVDEFRAGGIQENHISYAYKNPKEFIAVASEGDMSKYSNEFKELLVDFGMPRWVLDMPATETSLSKELAKKIKGNEDTRPVQYNRQRTGISPKDDAGQRNSIEKGESVRSNVSAEIGFKSDEQNGLFDGKYSRPLTEYDKIGNKVFELKSKDVTENPEKIAELKAEIEVLRKTEPKQAEELQIVLDMFTNPTSVHNVTDAQIDAVVNYLNSHYDNVEKYLTKQSGEIGISGENLGRFGHRIKGEWSTRDKIANYINDSIKKEQKAKEKGQAFTPRTLLDAYQDVRDKYACRTVFKNGNYANHPEIVKILEEGNYSDAAYRKAQLRAAEIQSQPAVDMLKEAMRKAVREGKDLSMMRISNYTSEGGIPIFSEAQLAELKDCGIELGIDVSFIKLASEKDPNTTKMIVDGATTKAQPSGYTALQVNFITKAGEIMEWQYRGERVNKFAEAEHLPYDIRTGKHPWRQYPELETLYKPIADLLAEKNMPKYAYDQLNRYFTDYYNHLRKLELGFESKEPKLEDYEHWKAKDKDGVEREYTFRFDKRLSAKNLEALHFYGEGIKDGAIAPERALKEYNAEVKYGSKDLPKPEVKAEKQSDRTPEVMNILNSREGLKNIREDIKTQIAGFVGKSKPENQEEIVKLIYKLKNAKERWGEKTQEYTDEQLLQIISVASNPDGTLNLTVLQRICKRMDGGPREDNSKMTRILPMDTKEHNLTRKSDGFYDEDLVEIGQKLMYAHKTREEIFRLLKDENGNPVKELTELIKTDKNEDFDDGEMLLNALRSLYTDGRLDLNKVNQMKELVNGGLTIYSASGAMQSGMPADIVKNMPLLAQKGLSRPDINRVVEYLKNNNIEPTFEAVKNTVENCDDIPGFREIHIKHLLSLRGETMAQSAYNNVLNLSERINEYYKRQPELAGKTPDLVSQYIKLLYVEGRTTQLTQREIMDLIGDMANNGTQRYNIDKLVDSGVLRDIPGRSKPLSKNDLLILQKEDFDVLKKAVEKGLLSDEYMNLCSLPEIKHALVTGGKSKLTRLTELSDTELKNLAYMDWSDLDFTTAISLAKCDPKKVDFVLDVMNIYTVPDYQKILLRDYNIDLAYKLFKEIDPHTTFPDSSVDAKVNDIIRILYVAKPHNIDEINYMYENRTELGITTSQIKDLISNEIKARDIRRLAKKIGKENISKIDERALPVAIRFADYYKVNDINELSAVQKRKLRVKLTECNGNLFDPSVQLLKKHFPLIPQDQTEYCSTMRDIVNSLGIETKPLTETQIGSFNESSLELGQSLGRMSDSDFSNLRITQEYSREDFIKTVLEKTKDLPKSEKLKVYDYFGFELHSNETNPTGYTLTGYPANINNGQKLAKIKSEATRQVVENLRGDVVRFSENNKIKCNDPQTEKLLNQVLETLPELRTMIGRTQHGTHDFDVMQHTLKVLQKITQEPYFEKLNESDKKVVTLAALMHDITKTEGKTDATHATQGSFDGFFISKKYNLTREEGIKMYTLMNMHEWLSFVNKPITDYELNNYIKEYNKNHSKSEQITHLTPDARERLSQEILTKRLQSVAFDLQQDNMFELSLMFTHADLKAVKKDDYFHDTVTMPSCATFDGKKRVFEVGNGQKVSHGQAADIYAERIRGYVDELKKTRPLTPVTKVPDSETIRSRITQINPDGSTNFKGVFVDKDGLVVIKFNDVEDWEALGFPKGTTTKGIKGTGKIKKEGGDIEESEFETGNFKFFAHALNFANQLSKFDSFALPDSDALLSVTYMERPESKYRNFNTQGIGLYVQSKYVHGGGNTDAGSGTGKSIDEFKKNYIFGGKREKDRTFTADIVKRATGMSDEEYVQFYEKNKNKTWEEVEPIDGSDSVEFRNKLIKAYAENIVSNERGDRAYDEYYVTNPEEPMFAWVYASDKNEKIGANPLEFLHRNNRTDKENKIKRIGHTAIRPVEERTQFLREYCLNRNKVMIVFGD